ncbi:hypothetical protein B0H16DRAFT_1667046 [Mycena metata]|uniref:CxC2-like cysteine cluster KDZ transposase-associated domain-containing protein n=1 Tax=Mycena metata TaxID=1033252 RepID=A0AAD7MFT9_9AGAR|nr:hypothetical protein B0H16DRAFT_1667046 [Mycena metata]
MVRRYGCGKEQDKQCRVCGAADSPFRCKNCYGDEMLCQTCILSRHSENPLHHIQVYNGAFFEATSLKVLGLRVQLGHPPRQQCSGRHQLHEDFVILHTNGIHHVNVDACACPENRLAAGSPEEQLLRAGWFPATDDRPRTCATFELLDFFWMTTHQAKTTMYDFYNVLEKITDNTGVKPPYRYHAFLRMCREYGHLMLLLGGERAHDASGVAGTAQGALAEECPSCPHPGVNIPDGWENTLPENKFLYILFLAIDACFRLKRRLISSELKDPALGSGWSYMVENTKYREYLLTVTDQKEMSTCSGLAALDYANTKFSRGYSATGVGMGVCARHEFVQANGVGDLQKGERYANMDWIFASILGHKDPRLSKIVSYDIVCQWWKNLRPRLTKLPSHIRLFLVMALFRFVIPKMHIHSHTLACQHFFSLNLIPGSAQTDREGIERPWAHIGGVAASTREMGPGSRADTLNSHFSFWNWMKLLGLGTSLTSGSVKNSDIITGDRLRTRLDRAKAEYARQLEAFTQFSAQQEQNIPEWRQMVDDFEEDDRNPNPYAMTVRGMSQRRDLRNNTDSGDQGLSERDVLLRLEADDAARVERGVPGIHSVSPTSFIAAALEVEEEQRRVRVQVELKKAGTTAQQIDVVLLRRKLSQMIKRVRTLQATYTPVAIVALGRRQNVPEDEPPELVPLFLPSALSAEDRAQEPVKGLAAYELELRDAQCSAALERLRNQLHMKSRLVTYKRIQARNQGANTRSRTIVERNEIKIRLSSEKYQMAWDALRRLVGGDPRRVGWRLLRREDIRCMEDAEELLRGADKRKAQAERRARQEDELRADGMLPPLTEEEISERVARGGENVREVSWIWTAEGTAGSDAEMEEALRIEWCKAYARTRRWREEVLLVEEEARRTPIFLEHRASQWEKRVVGVPVGQIPEEQADGLVAYALERAGIYRAIAARVKVSMTELRRGRGKRRLRVEEDEAEEDDIGQDDDEEELEDLRGNVSDEEFIMGGGDDED